MGILFHNSIFARQATRPARKDIEFIQTQTQSLSGLSERSLTQALSQLQTSTTGKDFRGRKLNRWLCQTIAFANEVVYRTQNFYLHAVQLEAVLAGVRGAIVEMQTGEGKTIVTAVIAVIKSMQFPHVHVATTNQYLATRDCENMRSFFEVIGKTSRALPDNNDLKDLQFAYDADITYGPGYQFGFDFLRDQVTLRNENAGELGWDVLKTINGTQISEQLVQRNRHLAMIIDEADSVMIDEALTPLILSGPRKTNTDTEPYLEADRLARQLKIDEDFEIDHQKRHIKLTGFAEQKIYQPFNRVGSTIERPWSEYIKNALQAQHLLHEGEHYIVKDGTVQIIDQMTGRILPRSELAKWFAPGGRSKIKGRDQAWTRNRCPNHKAKIFPEISKPVRTHWYSCTSCRRIRNCLWLPSCCNPSKPTVSSDAIQESLFPNQGCKIFGNRGRDGKASSLRPTGPDWNPHDPG